MWLLYALGIVGVLYVGFGIPSLQARLSDSQGKKVAAHWLRWINRGINQLPLPTLLLVYIIGAAECLITVVWKRGWFGHPSKKDAFKVIDQLVAHAQVPPGQTALITGGDSGIGFEIAQGLAQAGYHVVLASRTKEAGKAAQASIESLTATLGKVSFTCVDLCSLTSVRSWVSQIKKSIPKGSLSLLINNAGIMNTPFQKTEDGFESQSQTNYLSPLLLTVLLLPWMSSQGQILFASSSTAYCLSEINPVWFRQPYQHNGLDHYAHSKLCVAHATRALQKRLQSTGSKLGVHCYHPGTVRTRLFSHTTVFHLPFLSSLFDAIMLTPKEGSLTALHLCFCTEPLDGGHYWADAMPHILPDATVTGQGSLHHDAVLYSFLTYSLTQCHLEKSQMDALLCGEDPILASTS